MPRYSKDGGAFSFDAFAASLHLDASALEVAPFSSYKTCSGFVKEQTCLSI
jgi:hypothetical protein